MRIARMSLTGGALLFLLLSCVRNQGGNPDAESTVPRIANIIYFVRQTEPRPVGVSDQDLYQTVVEQVGQLNRYRLPATFLLQYDALICPRYQTLLKKELPAGSEIGGWWEITQPHVETAGLTWRGRYPWDWHADVGFSTGYTPAEREKLVDVYMAEFKSVFGYYPSSVGSWFIDAYTLQYMYDKYRIVASCNCKDQIGTDGYTLWGGYWNQGYYPSKKNAYIPAQTEAGQIPVPVFRMLGSDPIHQYYSGLGGAMQAVETLEPVNEQGGGDEAWVNWFFDIMVNEPALSFQYIQVGQENSFTWPRMRRGLEIQISKIDSLSRLGRLKVETLSETGRWFKKQYSVTPVSSVVALNDIRSTDEKSVWYDSRFFRANLYWHGHRFLLRDIHLFDERFCSDYLAVAGSSTHCDYRALPFVDGFSWSSPALLSGLRLMTGEREGTAEEIQTENVRVSEGADGQLSVTFDLLPQGEGRIDLTESRLGVSCRGIGSAVHWWLEFSAVPSAELPFTVIDKKEIAAEFKDFKYRVSCPTGEICSQTADERSWLYRIYPEQERIVLDMALREKEIQK